MYIAHTREIDTVNQSLVDHLKGTANMAYEFGEKFNNGDYAYVCGPLHDIGKYSDEFQKKIKNNTNARVDHSTAGAILINNKLKLLGKLLAYCIAGHHGGIPDGGNKSDTAAEVTLIGRLKRAEQIYNYESYKTEVDINKVIPNNLPKIKPLNKGGFSISFLVKMIYSCLVDADFLDTESFVNDNTVDRKVKCDFEILNTILMNHIEGFSDQSREINRKRSEILSDCIEKSECNKGLYTLTVPTGGGKTLSSLAFAINHVLKHGMDRIIYVIPYTSIIEQTARVFKNVLGEQYVLEHHSNFDFGDGESLLTYRLKLASENWDIPIIVTTNVQFFESLFSNRSSRCRKLHNISSSVIIFDEAQMLPTQFLTPCIATIAELVTNNGSTCILCSATQPSLKDRFPKEIEVNEICSNTDELYRFFKRTNIIYRGKMELDLLTEELNDLKQVLCIVNSKRHAHDIYSKLNGDGIYHLSTRMCPKHRLEVLNEIRLRLKNHLQCKVVSTQLIEAGVDVDFPVVYRSMAGIDSIVQAGGRCNRENRLDIGIVNVFDQESEYSKNMPSSIKRPIEVAKTVMSKYEDVLSPEAIHSYFEQLYSFEGEMGLDVNGIFEHLEKGAHNFNFDFKRIANEFKLIDEDTKTIIVEYDEDARAFINKLQYVDQYKSLLRAIQPYAVNVYENEFKTMYGANMIEVINDAVYVLKDINQYSMQTGLKFTVKTGVGIFM
ncbi:MAG: CRISPR-associated helicase Cas3' [Clostridiales bacterium]|nr:CRISPR-associated helicase Cas3' [Clostridiales bacterium]